MPLYKHKGTGEYCRTVLDSTEDDRLADPDGGWEQVDGKAGDGAEGKGKAVEKSTDDVRTGTGRTTVAVGTSGGES